MTLEYVFDAYGSACNGWNRSDIITLYAKLNRNNFSSLIYGERRWVLWLDDKENIFELVFQRTGVDSYVVFEVNRKLDDEHHDTSRILHKGKLTSHDTFIKVNLHALDENIVRVAVSFSGVPIVSVANVSTLSPENLFLAFGSETCFTGQYVDDLFWLSTAWDSITFSGFDARFVRLENRRTTPLASLNLDLSESPGVFNNVPNFSRETNSRGSNRNKVKIENFLNADHNNFGSNAADSLSNFTPIKVSTPPASGEPTPVDSPPYIRKRKEGFLTTSFYVDLSALLIVILLLVVGVCLWISS
ncbi:p30 [Soybean leaf crinkle mottle virus]|nr:p30 [Soybean leaf crinkle mottle virus]